jgi:ribosomal protein S18 acetylase RimI-like enzyme
MDSRSPDIPVNVRPFQPADQQACRALYLEGGLSGKLAENDTGIDIDDIQAAYMCSPGSHFWVAETSTGEIVGTIGVQNYEQAGEIRRLRVRSDVRRRGIGSQLMEAALRFCQDHGYLKVTLDTFMDREPAVRLFEKFHFKHEHSRQVVDRELLYFYLDLYWGDRPKRKK